MQNKYLKEIFKATIFSIIVAFCIVISIVIIFANILKEEFLMATDIIDMITIKTSEVKKIKPVLQTFEDEMASDETQTTVLMNTPNYGSKYATLKISSIGVELPIYYGKTLNLLKNGVGHDNDSYFPGEGGSIVLMGHNYARLLGKLPNAKVGDLIEISAEYGEFNYTIYDTQIVEETEVDKVPIQDKEEILMIYTCWPINNVGYATERYVVYAK